MIKPMTKEKLDERLETEAEEWEARERRKEVIRSRVSAQIRAGMQNTDRDVATLAKDSGVSASVIYGYLRCENAATVETIALIADALKVPPAVLLMPLEIDNGSDE